MQLSPPMQMFPHRPQFDESLRKLALLTHCPMQDSYPGPQVQKPPVQVSENEQRLPQRPQFALSFTYLIVSMQLPMHQSCPTEHDIGPEVGPVEGAGGVGGEPAFGL